MTTRERPGTGSRSSDEPVARHSFAYDVKLLPVPSERELLVITFPPEAFNPHCQDALGDILNAWARENNIMGRMIVMPQNMTINIVDEAVMAELGWQRIPNAKS